MSFPLVLITGATGFVGAHVLHQALEAGYPVRITVRPAKLDTVKEQYGSKVEVIPIADVASSDYTEALRGVGAIIHMAAPLSSKATSEEMIDGAVNGSLNVLRHAAAAGVKRIVVTSSWVTFPDMDNQARLLSNHQYNDKDWNPATKEQALDGTRKPFWAYSASKTVAEREIWKFAEEHPDMDITTINPPFIYGPLAPGYKVNKGDFGALSTDGYFYGNLLRQGSGRKLAAMQLDPLPFTVDVRDVARAHVLALKASPATEVGRKRIAVVGPGFSWKDAVEHLMVARPEVKSRLPDASEAQTMIVASTDTSRARDVLGLDTYIDWKKTVEDTLDTLLAVEKSWAA